MSRYDSSYMLPRADCRTILSRLQNSFELTLKFFRLASKTNSTSWTIYSVMWNLNSMTWNIYSVAWNIYSTSWNMFFDLVKTIFQSGLRYFSVESEMFLSRLVRAEATALPIQSDGTPDSKRRVRIFKLYILKNND